MKERKKERKGAKDLEMVKDFRGVPN